MELRVSDLGGCRAEPIGFRDCWATTARSCTSDSSALVRPKSLPHRTIRVKRLGFWGFGFHGKFEVPKQTCHPACPTSAVQAPFKRTAVVAGHCLSILCSLLGSWGSGDTGRSYQDHKVKG